MRGSGWYNGEGATTALEAAFTVKILVEGSLWGDFSRYLF